MTIICEAQLMPHVRHLECENPRPLPAVLTHSHAGGTVHNHEQYAMAEKATEWADHSHSFRADWQS